MSVAAAPQRPQQPLYIMVSPSHFTIRQSINPLSVQSHSHVHRQKAIRDFEKLVRTVKRLGGNPYIVSPDIIDPDNKTPDIIYSANWGISLPMPTAPFILARMLSAYRRHESERVAGFLLSHLRTNLFTLDPPTIFEGTGLTVWSHKNTHLWIGYGVRTSYRDARALSSLISEIYAVHALKAPTIHLLHIKNPWYDLDLAFLAFPNGKLLYRPDAFTATSIRHIKHVFGTNAVEFNITNSPFALNAKIINNTILCGTITRDAIDQLTAISGLPVVSCPLPEIEKGGGSVRCCMLDYYISAD